MSGALDNLPAVRWPAAVANAVELPRHVGKPLRPSNLRQAGMLPSGDLCDRLTEIARGCQLALEKNPAQPSALVGMCLVALASRQTDAAVKMASAAVASAPDLVVAWVALGQALKGAARHEEAAKAYERAIRLDGMNALAHTGLGELKIAAGRPKEAVAEFELALKRCPALVGAHLGLGNALACLGWNEEALEQYEAGLALRPRLPEG